MCKTYLIENELHDGGSSFSIKIFSLCEPRLLLNLSATGRLSVVTGPLRPGKI